MILSDWQNDDYINVERKKDEGGDDHDDQDDDDELMTVAALGKSCDLKQLMESGFRKRRTGFYCNSNGMMWMFDASLYHKIQ